MTEKNSVLVIGSGGREHAIVDALARSEKVGKIYCAPGNAGIALQAECVDIKVDDVEALAEFADQHSIDLTVVGPEASLAAGVADVFHKKGLKIFGPTKGAARIESSKEFAKKLMHKYHIPTGEYRTFTDFNAALEFVKAHPLPSVIKYDGLAAGKGVVVAETYEEAEMALSDMLLDASFGEGKVIIEEYLEGPEFSFMCVVSGERVYPLAIAQDHKRAYDGDKGPNTGGMGAYSPVPFITDYIRMEALQHIMIPAAKGLVAEGVPFVGVLYGGLILTSQGPKVIEFNARFGDPETEVVLPRLESDIYDLFESAVEGWDCATRWSHDSCLGIVLASKGYPGKYTKGAAINGLDKIDNKVYHMGTATDSDGKLVTAGGRVLMVTGMGRDLKAAHSMAMKGVAAIESDALFNRSDIGHQAL
ncbi:MAG: phosphoribosylamine--glycine ligase [Muribaculaceae bacterium]|nr:phosphoribosylamine--glycine ligase [Muribaculaceae bacterium]